MSLNDLESWDFSEVHHLISHILFLHGQKNISFIFLAKVFLKQIKMSDINLVKTAPLFYQKPCFVMIAEKYSQKMILHSTRFLTA